MNPSHDLQGLKKKAKETFLYVLSALLLGIAIGAIDAVFGRVLLFCRWQGLGSSGYTGISMRRRQKE